MQSPAPGEEKCQAPVHAGGYPHRKKADRKGLRGPSGYQVEHEPAMCTCHKEG